MYKEIYNNINNNDQGEYNFPNQNQLEEQLPQIELLQDVEEVQKKLKHQLWTMNVNLIDKSANKNKFRKFLLGMTKYLLSDEAKVYNGNQPIKKEIVKAYITDAMKSAAYYVQNGGGVMPVPKDQKNFETINRAMKDVSYKNNPFNKDILAKITSRVFHRNKDEAEEFINDINQNIDDTNFKLFEIDNLQDKYKGEEYTDYYNNSNDDSKLVELSETQKELSREYLKIRNQDELKNFLQK
jgi:hypothetical protein